MIYPSKGDILIHRESGYSYIVEGYNFKAGSTITKLKCLSTHYIHGCSFDEIQKQFVRAPSSFSVNTTSEKGLKDLFDEESSPSTLPKKTKEETATESTGPLADWFKQTKGHIK